jgi:hypothetical protein
MILFFEVRYSIIKCLKRNNVIEDKDMLLKRLLFFRDLMNYCRSMLLDEISSISSGVAQIHQSKILFFFA